MSKPLPPSSSSLPLPPNGFTTFEQRAAEFEKVIRKNHNTVFDEHFEALKTSHALLFNRWQQEGFAISYSEDIEKL